MRRRRLVAACGVVLVIGSLRRARRGTVSPGEERAFRRVNEAPGWLHWPIWTVMQAGSLAAVWVCAAAAVRARRRPMALVLATLGTAVWGGVKLVKPLIGRGRPADHLADVNVRGQAQSGLGYPSGHAAVSTTLGLVASSGASSPMRLAAGVTALTVGVARVYVGAHLPLDVVGGFGIGLVAGSLGAAAVRARSDR